jgi:prepilin-type N-terminal cleavage/methylation domain-containing protein
MKAETPQRGFTLIELAVVLIVIGILVGLGVALIGPLTKQVTFKRSRERVKACKEAIVGFVAASKRLPTQTEFTKICNEKDAWGQSLVYIPDDSTIEYDGSGTSRADLTSGTVCCSGTPDMAVNDKAMTGGTDNYRKDVAFIVLSKGEDRTANGTWTYNVTIDSNDYASYLIDEYSDNYDDIIEYVTVYELRDAINCEPLQILTNSFPDATEDSSYTVTLRATGGCQPYTWAISDCSGTASSLPTGLSLSGGAITGTPNIYGGPSGTLNNCSTTTGSFTISVTDSAGTCDEKSFTLVVRPQELRINTSSLPDGTVDMPYSANIIGSGGDISSYSYTVSGLPSGVTASTSSDCNSDTYNECSQLTGTPTGSCGDYPVSAQLSDSCTTTTKGYNIHLYKLISCSLSASDNGDGTWNLSYSITNGPVNGVFSPQSGTCTSFTNSNGGTCTTGTLSSDTTFVLSIADSCGDSAKCQVTVLASSGGTCSSLTNTTPNPLPDGTVGTAYSENITYTGGYAPITCSIASGSLPPGLTLSGCTITGTPTSTGTYNFTTRVTDSCPSGSQTSDKATSITVNPAPSPPTCTLSASPGIVAYGSTTTLTWSISNGPADGSFSPTSGTCTSFTGSSGGSCTTGSLTTEGGNTFTLTVSNAYGSNNCSTTVYVGCEEYRLWNRTGVRKDYDVGGTCRDNINNNREITTATVRLDPGEIIIQYSDPSGPCLWPSSYENEWTYDEVMNVDIVANGGDGDCRVNIRSWGLEDR